MLLTGHSSEVETASWSMPVQDPRKYRMIYYLLLIKLFVSKFRPFITTLKLIQLIYSLNIKKTFIKTKLVQFYKMYLLYKAVNKIELHDVLSKLKQQITRKLLMSS